MINKMIKLQIRLRIYLCHFEIYKLSETSIIKTTVSQSEDPTLWVVDLYGTSLCQQPTHDTVKIFYSTDWPKYNSTPRVDVKDD